MALGNPLFQQEYWANKHLQFTTDFSYRSGYIDELSDPILPDQTSGILGKINQNLRTVHSIFNNYNTTDAYLVVGAGCTALLHASIYAYTRIIGGPIYLYLKVPYYSTYRKACNYLNDWCTVITEINDTDISKVVEIVNYPNNPDGRLSFAESGSQYVIYDMVYHWPMMMPDGTEVQPLQFPIALYSMSKFSGHASTRFGWGWVKNQTVANFMADWASSHYYHVASDSTMRTFNIIDHVLKNKDEFVNSLEFALDDRWAKVKAILKDSREFTIASQPGTFFLFIKCNTLVGDDCFEYFKNNGVRTVDGQVYGASGHVRVNICGAPPVTFDIFLQKLQIMVNNTNQN